MTNKKNVTDAVRAANKGNAQSSTGPKTKEGKSHSSHNALKHGILTRKVVLDNHKQREEFRELLQRCKTELRPKGVIEKFIVEEIATLFWKLGIVEFLEARELLRRQELSDDVTRLFDNKTLELPISDYNLSLDRPWECERMVVRAVAGKDHRSSSTWRSPAVVQGQVVQYIKNSQNSDNKNDNHLEIEAVMGSALESVTRYQTKLKRDLYRAIEKLRTAQGERRESEKRDDSEGATLGPND